MLERRLANDLKAAGDLLERAYADLNKANQGQDTLIAETNRLSAALDRVTRRHAALTAHAWARVLSWVRKDRPALASILEHGRLVRFDAEVVEIAYDPQSFLFGQAQEGARGAHLQDALYAFFRARPEVRVVEEGRKSAEEWARQALHRAGVTDRRTSTVWTVADGVLTKSVVGAPVPPEPGQVWRYVNASKDSAAVCVVKAVDPPRNLSDVGLCRFTDGGLTGYAIHEHPEKWTLIGYQLPDGRRVMVGDRFLVDGHVATVTGILSGGRVQTKSPVWRHTPLASTILTYTRL